ncbi:MAG: lactonase family protein [Beutenbergiaceae bacterium]
MTTLLIGCYTEPMEHVNGHGEGIAVADFNGQITVRHVLAMRNPSWLTFDATRQVLFAVSEVDIRGEGEVVAFRRDGAGHFHEISRCGTGGSYPAHAAIDPDTGTLVVANYGTGSVATFQLIDERLQARDVVAHSGASIDPVRQLGPHTHQALFDPRVRQLLVPDLGTDTIERYRVGPAGELSHRGSVQARPGSGPRHGLFTSAGEQLLVLNELDSTIDRYDRDGENFVRGHCTTMRPDDYHGRNLAAALRMTGTGLVLASNRGLDAVALVRPQDPDHVRLIPSGGKEPRDLVASPDERFVLVANQDSDVVSVFTLSGADLQVHSAADVPSPACLLFI